MTTTHFQLDLDALAQALAAGVLVWAIVKIVLEPSNSTDTTRVGPGRIYWLTRDEQDRLEAGGKVTIDRYHGGDLVLTGTEVHPDGGN